MSFLETVEKARAYLERNGRVSLRGLQREFELDDDALAELVEELVDVLQVAGCEGKVLSWIVGTGTLWLEAGRLSEAEAYLRGGLEIAGNTGQHYWDAELHRLKGEIAIRRDDEATAGARFQDSLEIARRQRARSLELRTANSLARLWQRQGRTSEARQLLHPVRDAFTEGFETPDLRDAQALMEEPG